jgi:phosphohistidine phosphatase
MKILTLIRHAKSDWSDPDIADFDRPLNNRGKKAASLMAQRLLQTGEIPEIMITSAAKRARKTAKLMAHELQLETEKIIKKKEIYAVHRAELIECIKNCSTSHHIALVAHNPELSELGQWLCTASPEWLPTCAILTLELKIDRWNQLKSGCATIRNYDYPKKK